MTRNAKDKLNLIFGATAVGLAALVGAIGGSWMLFLLVAAASLTLLVRTGLIRSADDRMRTRRR